MFENRVDAGRRLAERLAPEYQDSAAIVLAIPRGGVVVAHEVARILRLRLDLIIPRKIGAPLNPELAIGAVAQGKVLLNENLVVDMRVPQEYIDAEVDRQMREIERRRDMYLGSRQPLPLQGETVIIIDDGLATGYTALVSVEAVKMEHPEKIVLAVPVAPLETYNRFLSKVDALICLLIPEYFMAVGQFYQDFRQTTDEEVVELLTQYRESRE